LNGDPGKNSLRNLMYYYLAGFVVANLGVVSRTEIILLFLSLQILFITSSEAKLATPRAFVQVSASYSANSVQSWWTRPMEMVLQMPIAGLRRQHMLWCRRCPH
jgi:hypothetical protein